MDFVDEIKHIISLNLSSLPDFNIKNCENNKFDETFYEISELITKNIIYHHKPEQHNNRNFTFTANSSLSGGGNFCSSLDCRMSKLDELVSFASLYADCIYIRHPFEKIYLHGFDKFSDNSRLEFINGIILFYYLEPFIKKGIIKYVNEGVTLCKNHWDSLGIPLEEKIKSQEKKLTNLLEEYLLSHCSITFNSNSKGNFLEFKEKKEELIPHSRYYLYFYPPYPNFIQKLKNKKTPYVIPIDEIKKYDLFQYIINGIIDDVSIQEWHSNFYNTSYLSDNKRNLDIIKNLNSEVSIANATSFEKALNHNLPVIFYKDAQDILNLRERENEAFQVYRDKLNSILQTKSQSWNDKELSELFRDQILPELNIINKKVNNWKSNLRSNVRDSIYIGAGSVSIGLYSGILPPEIGNILALFGGGKAISDILVNYKNSFNDKNEAYKNDFYFLWQANK